MKIFVSWSGERSSQVAKSLAEWIPYVLPSVEPWVSSHDIAPGTRWATELVSVLANCHFGIICLTEENLRSPWILFESGSLAKQFEMARVVPYLLGLKPADIEFPLAQFQSVEATQCGTRDLLWSINRLLVPSMTEERFKKVTEKWWPDLEQKLDSIEVKARNERPVRDERDILEEILETVRSQHREQLLSTIESSPDGRARRQGTKAILYWHESGFTSEQANVVCKVLEKAGISAVMTEHRNRAAPDTVFIGALVGAEDAQLALRIVPYQVKYIFRPDYPAPLGGDDSGLTIGLGYMSDHYQAYRDSIVEPVPISDSDLERLTSPVLSNTEFQALLRQITW